MTRPATREDLVVTRWNARFLGRIFPCSIGRGGIRADKREGDGASPAGAFAVVDCRYRADRRARPRAGTAPVAVISAWDAWIDDPEDARYNTSARGLWIRASHERLMRADPLYDFVITTDHNRDRPVPGAGSAIFIHAWRRPRFPTAGCAAFAPHDLDWIAARLTPRSRVIFRA